MLAHIQLDAEHDAEHDTVTRYWANVGLTSDIKVFT